MNRTEPYSQTKEKIRESAMALFRERGYDNVTVVQICEASGITKRTFYYHYTSKRQLISGLTDSLGAKAELLLDTLISQQTNVGMLWELMSVYSINSENYGADLIKHVYIMLLEGEVTEDFPFSTYLYDTVLRCIKNAQYAGEILNASAPEDIAFSLYHAFRSVTITWASENGGFDLVKAFRQVFDAILNVSTQSQTQDQS